MKNFAKQAWWNWLEWMMMISIIYWSWAITESNSSPKAQKVSSFFRQNKKLTRKRAYKEHKLSLPFGDSPSLARNLEWSFSIDIDNCVEENNLMSVLWLSRKGLDDSRVSGHSSKKGWTSCCCCCSSGFSDPEKLNSIPKRQCCFCCCFCRE